MFSKASRSWMFLFKTKCVTCPLLYSLSRPLGHSAPRWPVPVQGLPALQGSGCPTAHFLPIYSKQQAPPPAEQPQDSAEHSTLRLLSGAEKTALTGAPAVFRMIPSIQRFGSLQVMDWPQ